jgi:hypothetical protein
VSSHDGSWIRGSGPDGGLGGAKPPEKGPRTILSGIERKILARTILAKLQARPDEEELAAQELAAVLVTVSRDLAGRLSAAIVERLSQ